MTKEEAIKTLKENVCLICAYGGKNIDECDIRYCDNREAFNIAIEALENQKTGHWIDVTNGRGGHKCDNCHDYAPSYQSGVEYLAKYCPNCGAKMEGERE